MKKVNLGFKAFDLHELGCHFVSDHCDIYRENGLDVRLLDTTFIPDSKCPPPTFHAACGAALVACLAGERVKVGFVATDRPMFWLYTRPAVRSIESLRNKRIASFPSQAPPAYFLRTVLRQANIDPDNDLMIEPARDDIARLGLLRAGDVDAALISSAILPVQVKRMGFHSLLFVGDSLRIPSTGLAFEETLLKEDPDVVETMLTCYREALRLIHDGNGTIGDAISRFLPLQDDDLESACGLLRACYTRQGNIDKKVTIEAVGLMSQETGSGQLQNIESLYDLLK